MLRTKYGRFPTSLERFLDSWRVSDPALRREHAIEYLQKVNPGVLENGNLRD